MTATKVGFVMKNLNELSEREILAMAISLEEEDEAVYTQDFAEGPPSEIFAAARPRIFESRRTEEGQGHRHRLIDFRTYPPENLVNTYP